MYFQSSILLKFHNAVQLSELKLIFIHFGACMYTEKTLYLRMHFIAAYYVKWSLSTVILNKVIRFNILYLFLQVKMYSIHYCTYLENFLCCILIF